MKNLNSLLRVLLKNEIDFVLIGGYAGVVHGATQLTRDLDVCVAISPEQIAKLRHALKDLNPRHRMNPNFKPSFETDPKDLSGVNNIYLETDLGVLDILGSVSAVGSFEIVRKNSIEIKMYGYECRVISVEALIKAKEYLGRPKDKLVVSELRALQKK